EGQARGAAGRQGPRPAPGRQPGQGRAVAPRFADPRRQAAPGGRHRERLRPMANKWFETVAVAQQRARKRLPKSVYGALVAGAEKGLTVRDNVAAFSELGFAPHVAGLSA